MFLAGDHILYGTSGVCRIDAVVPSPFDKNDERLFYVLRPLQGVGNAVIYTPVDNDKVAMRALMAREEAETLVGRMAQIGTVRVELEKHRRETYRQVIASQDPAEYVSLIKTVHGRRMAFSEAHKRLPDMDNEYEDNARKSLYAELGLVFGIPFGEVGAFLRGRIGSETEWV